VKKFFVRIIILVLILAAVFAVFKFTPVGELLNIKNLAESRDELILTVQSNLLLSAIVYIGLYIIVVALSIPGATVLSVLGGFFFGPVIATLFINVGATAGAFIIFIAARYFLGEMIQTKYPEKLEKFNREIDKNGKNYMLTLRFIPIFPFFLINLLAGFTKIPALTFLWTTSLGIIPGSFVYAYLGNAGAVLGQEGAGMPKELIIALVLLAFISILPVGIKKMREKKKSESESSGESV
jgi:uncharacterized membrane protein YdjX (TVP38/TMEM64 family)